MLRAYFISAIFTIFCVEILLNIFWKFLEILWKFCGNCENIIGPGYATLRFSDMLHTLVVNGSSICGYWQWSRQYLWMPMRLYLRR